MCVTDYGYFAPIRSKSRSVDHGIASPFDLEALRAKVDNQVERTFDRGEIFLFFCVFKPTILYYYLK